MKRFQLKWEYPVYAFIFLAGILVGFRKGLDHGDVWLGLAWGIITLLWVGLGLAVLFGGVWLSINAWRLLRIMRNFPGPGN